MVDVYSNKLTKIKLLAMSCKYLTRLFSYDIGLDHTFMASDTRF